MPAGSASRGIDGRDAKEGTLVFVPVGMGSAKVGLGFHPNPRN